MTTLSNQLYVSIPTSDARFAELRTYLAPALGQASDPTQRMLGEYALLGFLITTGRINLGQIDAPAASAPEPFEEPNTSELDPAFVHEVEQHIARATQSLGMFDDD